MLEQVVDERRDDAHDGDVRPEAVAAEPETLVEEDVLLVEDVSIDGMCGVY